MKHRSVFIPGIVSFFLIISCQPKTGTVLVQPDFGQGPPTIVYKTNDDYARLIAVTYSEALNQITQFPAPSDIRTDENSSLPAPLADDYWLDRLGIGPETAFTSYTQSEYAALKEPPHPDSLLKRIIHKNPFTEMYNCGNRFHFENPEIQINALIKAGELSKRCKKLIP
ncbi:MAG: hypothetical protein PHG67_07340 [Bacteroidales bacterium]|jgi:hypothetical protein|nr:hypothetical protein [Bacteroidales bacterium]